MSIAAPQLLPLDTPGAEAAAPRTAFAGIALPVRPIEVATQASSAAPLVRVPCAGQARRDSSCWVASR